MPSFESRLKPRAATTVTLLAGLGFAWALWFAIRTFGNRQFGGYDHAVLVDAPYRLLQGQRPFVDFYFTLPPLFAGGAWGAFAWLGPRWDSLIQLTGILAIGAFAVQAIQFRCMGRGAWESMGLAFAFQAMTLVTGSYWWYNPLSLVVAGLLLGQCALLIKGPRTISRWCGFALMAVLVLLSKPNTAVVSLGVCFLVLNLGRETWKAAWISVGIALLVAFGLLHAWRMNPGDLLSTYKAMAGRGAPAFSRFSQDRGWLASSMFLLGSLSFALFSCWCAMGGLGASGRRSEGRLMAWVRPTSMQMLSVGTVLTGFYSCFTNAEPQLIAFPLLALPFLWFPSTPGSRQAWRGIVTLGTLGAFALGSMRYRVELIGPERFYQDGPRVRIDQRIPFFEGFEASPVFAQVLDDLQGLLGTEPGRVFFGPRMEWAYAVFNRPSPVGLPIWWDPGVSYPAARSREILNSFRGHKFDLCVFFRGDFTRMPLDLLDDLLRNSTAEVRGQLLVLRPRKEEGKS